MDEGMGRREEAARKGWNGVEPIKVKVKRTTFCAAPLITSSNYCDLSADSSCGGYCPEEESVTLSDFLVVRD